MESLDALLTKIKSEGVEVARAEADAIVAKAKAEAAHIVSQAQKDAETLIAQAKTETTRLAQGAEATIRQAARDVLLKLGQDITALLEHTLGNAVDETLQSKALVEKFVTDAVVAYLRDGDVTVIANPELASALEAKLAAQKQVTVVTDPLMGTGFRVTLAGGRVEHDFTGEAVTEALAKLLRPQLAQLLKD